MAQAQAWDLPTGNQIMRGKRKGKTNTKSSAFPPWFIIPSKRKYGNVPAAVYRWSNALLCEILPPASPRPSTGLLYDQPANCCCIV